MLFFLRDDMEIALDHEKGRQEQTFELDKEKDSLHVRFPTREEIRLC